MHFIFERGGRGGRHCGEGRAERHGMRGGRWQKGPIDLEWSFSRGGPGSGRGRRMFDGGELRLVLLKLIADQSRHGYELIRAIEDLTGGAYAPSPGVVYPTLTMLDEMGLIEAVESAGAKKAFAITDTGRAELEANAAQVEALLARLAQIGAMRAKTDATSIRRAMQNLRQVLQDRLTAADVSEETLHQVTALLDEAAQKIERL